MFNEFKQSVNKAINKRLTTPIYGTFFIYWVIFHWNFVYTTFFVSEDKIWQSTGLLKNIYLEQYYFNYHNFDFFILWILPVILTWLTIWFFPKYVLISAFKKDEEYETEKIIFRINERMPSKCF
jgi:hypothetical protein